MISINVFGMSEKVQANGLSSLLQIWQERNNCSIGSLNKCSILGPARHVLEKHCDNQLALRSRECGENHGWTTLTSVGRANVNRGS